MELKGMTNWIVLIYKPVEVVAWNRSLNDCMNQRTRLINVVVLIHSY